jgi:hypothetical protein
MTEFEELPLSMFDPERLRNLIEIGVNEHPDPERVSRFLRSGASFVMHREKDGRLHFGLAHTASAPWLASVRAEVWGTEPEEPADEDEGRVLSILRAPASILGQPPQG